MIITLYLNCYNTYTVINFVNTVSTITLDDIFALFRESEQQRKDYQHKAELEMAELRKTIDQTSKQIAQTNKQVGG